MDLCGDEMKKYVMELAMAIKVAMIGLDMEVGQSWLKGSFRSYSFCGVLVNL